MQTLTPNRNTSPIGTWIGSDAEITTDPEEIKLILRDLGSPSYLLDYQNQIGVVRGGDLYPPGSNKKASQFLVFSDLSRRPILEIPDLLNTTV